jgi:hypothetical protein
MKTTATFFLHLAQIGGCICPPSFPSKEKAEALSGYECIA